MELSCGSLGENAELMQTTGAWFVEFPREIWQSLKDYQGSVYDTTDLRLYGAWSIEVEESAGSNKEPAMLLQ